MARGGAGGCVKRNSVCDTLESHVRTLTMPERIYFDTVVFREIGTTFEKKQLPSNLWKRVIISPITVFDVLF